ncbi:MAG: FAD-dependent oxidoreductase [Candidatus Thorarchaeota archaeon]
MRLLESINVGNLELENRIILLATHLGYCSENGIVTDRIIEFYRERARFRPGLIVVGGCYTEKRGRSGPTMIGISSDDHIEGLNRLTSAIHDYNVPAAAQLYHAGRYSHEIFIGEQPVSASSEYTRLTRTTPRPLSIDEIAATVENFGLAARRAQNAGFDGVEIIGSAGYIINQFLARATNKRTDEYNGDLRARARFALEVIESVRTHVGDSYTVIYRMSGDDFVEDGTTLKDNRMIAPWLVDAGVDCINVTGGWHETRVPQITMDVPRGHYSYLAEGIAEVVDVPVVACNRINSPTVAEKILQRGKARLIGMSRGFIADPEIMEKIRNSRFDSIRTCIGCNIGCLDQVFLLEPVVCSINPIAGYEGQRALGTRAEGRIAVVGAGPAGMEASRVLRMRGYDVTLFDKSSRPGGLLNLASKVPLRGEFATYCVHMWRELKRLGVNLELGTKATIEILQNGGYDAVVCATGTIPAAPAIEGVESPHVTSAYDVMSSGADDLGRVSILGADSLGCHAALYLSSRADSIDLFALGDVVGEDIGISTRWVILQALKNRNVTIHKNVEISQITSNYIMIEGNDDTILLDADTVVVAAKPQPRVELYDSLMDLDIRAVLIGSARKSMNLLDAVHDAFLFATDFSI